MVGHGQVRASADRYEHSTSFSGKAEFWEEWHTKVKGVIKSDDSEAMEVITYAEFRGDVGSSRLLRGFGRWVRARRLGG